MTYPLLRKTVFPFSRGTALADGSAVGTFLCRAISTRTVIPGLDSMPDSIRVMVVDDDPAMCEFLTEFLRRRGYKTESVQTADEAVRRFEYRRRRR